jgi:hypothetical protein
VDGAGVGALPDPDDSLRAKVAAGVAIMGKDGVAYGKGLDGDRAGWRFDQGSVRKAIGWLGDDGLHGDKVGCDALTNV